MISHVPGAFTALAAGIGVRVLEMPSAMLLRVSG